MAYLTSSNRTHQIRPTAQPWTATADSRPRAVTVRSMRLTGESHCEFMRLAENVNGFTEQLSTMAAEIRSAASMVADSLIEIRRRSTVDGRPVAGQNTANVALAKTVKLDTAPETGNVNAAIRVIDEIALQTNLLALGASAAATMTDARGEALRG